MRQNTLNDLPPNLLTIKNGQVQILEIWCCWNGENSMTTRIERLGENHFRMYSGDPGHGGGTSHGTLDEVLQGLHPNVAAEYRYIFSLVELSPTSDFRMLPQFERKFLAVAA
jgi:hypothetical protein